MPGEFVGSVCGGSPDGRAFGNAVLEANGERPVTLRLKRRGREFTAALTIDLPARPDAPAETRTVETGPITMLRSSGTPAVLAGHTGKANAGESHAWLERFAIESVAP